MYADNDDKKYHKNDRGVKLNNFYTDIPDWYELEDENDDTLIFESRFESGNLMKAFRVGLNEYNLYLNPDTNNNKHTRWFYFKLSNVRKGLPYRFNINNLENQES